MSVWVLDSLSALGRAIKRLGPMDVIALGRWRITRSADNTGLWLEGPKVLEKYQRRGALRALGERLSGEELTTRYTDEKQSNARPVGP